MASQEEDCPRYFIGALFDVKFGLGRWKSIDLPTVNEIEKMGKFANMELIC